MISCRVYGTKCSSLGRHRGVIWTLGSTRSVRSNELAIPDHKQSINQSINRSLHNYILPYAATENNWCLLVVTQAAGLSTLAALATSYWCQLRSTAASILCWVCHDVCVCVCVCVCMWHGAWVWVCTSDRNDLKLGTVLVLETMSRSTDIGFKRSRVRVWVRELAPISISRECTYLPFIPATHYHATEQWPYMQAWWPVYLSVLIAIFQVNLG